MSPKYIEIYDLVQPSPEDYFMHHQIKGAKWGVHRGPPYPLESGIRTKIKKVTNAAKERAKENREKRATAKQHKEDSKAEKKETLQDKINKMSNEELKAQINRLKLENEYRSELSKSVVKGKNFIEKGSDLLNTLKVGTDALDGFVKSGKKLLLTFGLMEEETKNVDRDYNWSKRKPGETAKEYSQRLNDIKNIRSKLKEFAQEDKKEAEKKAKEAAAAKAKREAEKKQAEATAERLKERASTATAEAQADLEDFRRRNKYWF